MKVRFQADNDLKSAIRKGVLRRESAIDFQAPQVLQLDGVLDPEVLRLAMAEGRLLVSHDVNSMPGHFHDFVAAGNRSPGLVLVHQDARISDVIEDLLLIWIASDAHEWENRLVWLPL